MKEGVRRLLVVAMMVVDTKYRCSQKKPWMVVPFVVDERELLKQRGERERGNEGSLQKKRHEYGRFRLIVVVVVIDLKFKKNARWLDGMGMKT